MSPRSWVTYTVSLADRTYKGFFREVFSDAEQNMTPSSLLLLKLPERLATLFDLRGDLAVDVLQRDRVSVGELDVIESHRESLVVH